MKDVLSKCWGFRSGVPWKKLLAVVYYAACLGFLIIGMTTPPLIEAGPWDTFVVKLSTFILFLWMLSPAIFLSETPLRDILPFFRDRIPMRSLVGLMIVFVLFQYLFMTSEGLHTPEYQEVFTQYISASYETFVEAGSTGSPYLN